MNSSARQQRPGADQRGRSTSGDESLPGMARYRSSLAGRFLGVEQALAELLGYAQPQELIERIRDIGSEFYAEPGKRAILLQQLREHGSLDGVETLVYRKDGETRRLVEHARAVRDPTGEIAYLEGTFIAAEQAPARGGPALTMQKYRAMFENSVVGMYRSTPCGRLLDANRAMARLLGFHSVEQLMREVGDIRSLYAHPEERNTILEELNRDGSMMAREYQVRTRTGDLAWVLENSRVVAGENGEDLCYEGTLQDISARKAAEEALFRSEQRYRALVETGHVGIFLSVAGKCVYVNRALAAMLDYQEEQMLGRDCSEFYAPEAVAAAQAEHAARQSCESSPSFSETALLHRDGSTRVDVTIDISTFEQDGKFYSAGAVIDVTRRKRVERQLIYNATHDALTGLRNRAYFIDYLSDIVASTPDFSYAVLFIDLDGFKLVNDSFGHSHGDRVLVEAAERLKRTMGSQCLIARHGGDEFTVLLENVAPDHDFETCAKRINGAFAAPFTIGSSEIFLNASIGVALSGLAGTGPEEVLRNADAAMYYAKASGKGCHAVFSNEMRHNIRRRIERESEMRLALERDELEVYYQPIFDLRRGRLAGLEALLRWKHAQHGMISPTRFMGTLRDSGLLLPVGWWVLHHASQRMVEWKRDHAWAQDLAISVNISPQQFMAHSMVEQVQAALQSSELPAGALCLDIAGTGVAADGAEVAERLSQLKALGVRLHLDDFGTGFLSLTRFGACPLDAVKLDPQLTGGSPQSTNREVLLRAVVQLTRDLGIDCIAEGVETAAQVRHLLRLGVQYGQGILLAPPMPAAQVATTAWDRQYEWHSLADWLPALYGRLKP